jgi:hypothetical protein
MADFYKIGKMIQDILNKASKEDLTIWLVEEETGEGVKLYDMMNAEKHAEDAIFTRIR